MNPNPLATYTAHRRLGDSQLMVFPRHFDSSPGPALLPAFARFDRLGDWLRSEDLLILNASGTLPASLHLGEELELRLAAFAGPSAHDLREWWAITFGAGDWRQPTEARGVPPVVRAGDWLTPFLQVLEVHPAQPRLLRVRFEGPDYVQAIYALGRPIQYAYHQEELKLWDVQTLIGGLPLSTEPPSALMPFTWRQLLALPAARAFVLHGAGLSSTGDARLDEFLPLPEFYSVPAETAAAIASCRARGGRVIAVGTSAARAVESVARSGRAFGEGTTALRSGPRQPVRAIDGLLTGWHEPGTSHFRLEEALVPRFQLETAYARAAARGFVGHEFGDAVLIL